MCSSSGYQLVNATQPTEKNPLVTGGVFGTVGVNKPPGTKCFECDGYECCCIPIPCVIM